MNAFETTLAKYTPQLTALLRIMAGLLFMEHGMSKFFGFPGAAMPSLPPLLMLAGVLELAGGLLVALGLFTRPVAFLLAGEMAVAYFMGHFPKDFFPINNGGDAAILYCFVFLFFAAAGGGLWSLDSKR